MRRILEGEEELPEAIAKTIRQAIGVDKKPLQATIIVGLLQALQGDEKWAKLLLPRGYGKIPDVLIGDVEQPIAHTFTLKIDNS
ncbi:hypothetical protein ABIF90_001087 [Bradyrhizobium japonicum]